ncbi:hypothetical protein DL98DRAFT_614667 [Cadophora sp. DSE1049]|nr:hypothetical protein DL98DRAFT_614667 [Cadophora sp. DSE1049]
MLHTGVSGSVGVPVPELNGFQRTGSFPFMKLPLEIRRKVYRLLLGGCSRYDPDKNRNHIDLYFTPQYSLVDLEYGDIVGFDDENNEDEASSGNDEVDIYNHWAARDDASHPARVCNYELMTYPYRAGVRQPGYDHTDWMLLHFIRQLSHISPVIRQELGDPIWSRSAIQWSPGSKGECFWMITKLLKEQLAIHVGLKSLNFILNTTTFEAHSTRKFKNWCFQISRLLRLEKFHMHVFHRRRIDTALFIACLRDISKNVEHDKMRYDILEKVFLQESMLHPQRSHDYDITAQISRPRWAWSDKREYRVYPQLKNDWPMLMFMRHLSNVSVQFRHELAKVLFANVAVTIDFNSCIGGGLQGFLIDSPKIRPNIRYLKLEAEFSRKPMSADMSLDFQSSIQKLCDIEGFEIPVLRFSIKLSESGLKTLFAKDEYLNDFSPIRRIPVTQSFEPTLNFASQRECKDKAAKVKHHEDEELNKKYLPALQAALRPDTLRVLVKQTEEAEYLRERKLMLSDAGSA